MVLIVAWYFLMISPKRSDLADVQQKRDAEKRQFETDKARLERLPEERRAALQAQEDLLKINKLIPVDEQVPSMIIELNQSAHRAGIDFVKIAPKDPVEVSGNTVVPMDLAFEGRFFDVNDFLYRVENYARLEGSDVNVSGRFISVVTVLIELGDLQERTNYVTCKLGINTYITAPAPPSKTAGRAADEGAKQNEQAAGAAQGQ